MAKKKDISVKTKEEKLKEHLALIGFFKCKSCEEQCLGHGGVASNRSGCFCNDGTKLDCLEKEE